MALSIFNGERVNQALGRERVSARGRSGLALLEREHSEVESEVVIKPDRTNQSDDQVAGGSYDSQKALKGATIVSRC